MATAIDNLGRRIDTANMTLGEIRGLISTMMKTSVGPAKPIKENVAGQDGPLKEIQKILINFTKDFSSEVKEQTKIINDVVDALKSISSLRDEKKSKKKEGGGPTKEEKDIKKATEALSKEFHKTLGTKGSGWVHDIHCEAVLKKIYAALKIESSNKKLLNTYSKLIDRKSNDRALKSKTEESSVPDQFASMRTSNKSNSANSPPRPPRPPRDDYYEAFYEYGKTTFIDKFIDSIDELSRKIQETVFGFNPVQTIIEGSIAEERKFTQEIRATAYEVAGATKESRRLQRAYEDIGKSVTETGFSRTETQESYKKNLRAGIRDMKTALSISKIQLNTESQIGVEAGTLNEEFKFMSQAAHMNTSEIAAMGRGMLDVARTTGITGDQLSGAIKSSQSLVENFQKSGRLTSEIYKNIVGLVASAKKLGAGTEIEEDLRAMSSTYDFLNNTSDKQRNFLLMATNSVGKQMKLFNGTMLSSKKNFKELAKGMTNVLASQIRGLGIELPEKAMQSAESIQAFVDTLDDGQKSAINNQMEMLTGRRLGAVLGQIGAYEEQSKSITTKLKEVQNEIDGAFNKEEKLAAEEKKRQILADYNLDIVSELIKATKGVGSGVGGMNEALKLFEKEAQKNGMPQNLKDMGKEWTTSGEVAKKAISDSLEQLNIGRKKAGLNEIEIDSENIQKAFEKNASTETLKKITNSIEEGQRELAAEQKASADPVSESAKYLFEINENIRNYTQSIFSKLFNSLLGKVIVVSGILISIASAIGLFSVNIGNQYKRLGKLLGKGAAETAEAGSTVARGARGAAETAEAGSTVARGGKIWPAKEAGRFGKFFEEFEKGFIKIKNKGIKAVQSIVEKLRAADQFILNEAKTFEFSKTILAGANNFFKPFMIGFKRAKSAEQGYIAALTRGTRSQLKSIKPLRDLANSKIGSKFMNSARAITKYGNKAAIAITKYGNKAATTMVQSATKIFGETAVKGMERSISKSITKLGLAKDFIAKSTNNFFKPFMIGFKRAKSAEQGYIAALTRGTRSQLKSIKPLRNSAEAISKYGNKATMAITKIGDKAATTMVQSATKIFGNTAVEGVRRFGKVAVEGMTKFFPIISNSITKLGLSGLKLAKVFAGASPIGAIMNIGFAFMGALEAGDKAGDIFGKSMRNVTLNEQYAAKSAGFLIGVLDALTFGIAGLILPLDIWTAYLAKFNAKVPILTIALTPLILALEIVWGVIKGVVLGIWEIIKGIGGGIMNIINPIIKGLSDIFSSIGSMFGETSKESSKLLQAFNDIGGVVGIVSGTISFIGKGIGYIFRIIGGVIGFIIKTILKFIEGLLYAFQPIIDMFSAVFGAVGEVAIAFGDIFMGLYDAFSGVLDAFSGVLGIFGSGEKSAWGFFDAIRFVGLVFGKAIGLVLMAVQPFIWGLILIAKVISGIAKLVQAVVKVFRGDFSEAGQLVKDAMWGLVEGIIYPFKYLYNILVGNSIIPDLVTGIITWFAKLPGKIIGFLISIPIRFVKLLGKIIDLILYPFKLLGTLLSALDIFGVFTAMGKFGSWIWDSTIGAMGNFGSWLWNNTIGAMSNFGSWIWDSTIGAMGNFGSWLWDNTIGAMSGFGSWLYENTVGRILSILPSWLGGGKKETTAAGGGGETTILQTATSQVIDIVKTIPEMIGDVILGGLSFFKSIGMMIIDFVTSPFKWILNFVSAEFGDKVVGKIQNIFGAIFDIIVFPFTRLAKIFKILGKTLKMIGKLFKGDFSGAFDMLKNIGKEIIDLILYPFKLLGSLLSALDIFGVFTVMGNFGSWLWDNTIGAMGNFGSWIWNNTIGAMSGFGSWLYENTVGRILSMLPSWLGGTKKDPQEDIIAEQKKINAGQLEQRKALTDKVIQGGNKEEKLSRIKSLENQLQGAETNLANSMKSLEEANNSWDLLDFGGAKAMSQNSVEIDQGNILSLTKELGKLKGSEEENSIAKNSEATAKELQDTLGTKGSGWVHDPYCESILNNVLDELIVIESKMFNSFVNPFEIFKALNPMNLFGGTTPSEKVIEQRKESDQVNIGFDTNELLLNLNKFQKKQVLQDRAVQNLNGIFEEEKIYQNDIMIQQQDVMIELLKILNITGTKKTDSFSTLGIFDALNPTNLLDKLNPMNWFGAKASEKPIQANEEKNVRPTINPVPNLQDIHTIVAGEKASVSPNKTEVTSPELGTLASEASEQTVQLEALVNLFQQVVDALKPKSQPITSEGGAPGNTASKKIAHKPANFYRSTVGLVSQTAGKAILNIGSPNA
jgi:hypothetical protein